MTEFFIARFALTLASVAITAIAARTVKPVQTRTSHN